MRVGNAEALSMVRQTIEDLNLAVAGSAAASGGLSVETRVHVNISAPEAILTSSLLKQVRDSK